MINRIPRRNPLVYGEEIRRESIKTNAVVWTDFATIVQLAFVPPPACFDAECQANKDAIFFASIIIPVVIFGIAAQALVKKEKENLVTLESEARGNEKVVFEVDADVADLVARDKRGEIVYRAIGYTPWLTEQGPEDECIRIETGTVGKLKPQSYLFDKKLAPPSKLLTVTLPRPLGIIFEEDYAHKRAVVAEIVEGSNADQLAKRSALGPSGDDNSPRVGDVLRACTTTNIVYKPAALAFGAQIPERAIVLFGADNERWSRVAVALKRGLKADGPVTLVLERQL